MRLMPALVFAGLLGSAAVAQAAPVSYTLDPTHTMVLFSWNHFGFSNPTADIGVSTGTIVYDEANPAKSSVEVTMPLDKLDTHVPALDTHLKSADFFNAAKFADVSFKSTKVQPLGGNRFKITGDLTAHGVTKSVVLNAKLNKVGLHPMVKKQAIGFDATGVIKRSEFGLGAYAPMVSDNVTLHITTEAEAAK